MTQARQPTRGGSSTRSRADRTASAVAPSNTATHHALLLINPHTSFFFRSELQMSSDEGLNAYGAVTWGQFFIYQGFNERAGWMHTSSGVDAVDEYLETVTKKGDGILLQVRQRGASRDGVARSPCRTRPITAWRRRNSPSTARITARSCAKLNGKWVSIRIMQEPIKALAQSYMRTKATDYKSYRQTMELKANSSNNTIFADADGDIAYFHGNFIPRRDTKFDWTKPVDGSNPATEWQGLLTVDETPHLLNPQERLAVQHQQLAVVAAGPSSPKREDYPAYVETGGESARGLHAIRVLQGQEGFHARFADRGGLRQLSTVVREADAGADQGLGRGAGVESAEGETRRADRDAAQVGSALGGGLRCRRRSPCSGAKMSGGA